MGESNHLTTALAAIGGASLLFVGVSLGKLALALKKQSDFKTIFHQSAPQTAHDGRVFLITGASSGIGRALATHLCSNYDNIKLILSSRRKDVLEEVATECRGMRSSNEVKILPLDLSELSDLPSKAKEALALFGRVDVLVNNGGVSTRSLAHQTDFEVDVHVTNVDFLSYVLLTKALLPSWTNSSDTGFSPMMVVNTSSVAGRLGAPVRSSYCGAKHAIHGWFDAFRVEQLLLGHPVNVLNVVLGSTRTNIARNAIVESVENKFGSNSDANIDNGLQPEFVVERVLAAANAGRQEIWIAPKKELLMLYLNQYVPDLARKIMLKSIAKQYAVTKGSSKISPAD